MAPSQTLVDIDTDRKPNSLVRVGSDDENKNLLGNPDGQVSRCVENRGGTMFGTEALLETKEPKPSEDVDVDIIKCTYISDVRLDDTKDPDATEYSSSFGNTVSGNENCSGFSEAEVESQFYGDNDLAAFDPFSNIFQARKKKLTSHWRNFIRPLMWRCKWAELRIKEIESQKSKYCRELAEYDRRKKSELDQFRLEGFDSKSSPFSSHYYRKKAMKRRKRRRVEETTDMSSYVSQHNLFSYLENKRSDPDSTSAADDFINPVTADQYVNGPDEFETNSDQPLLEFRDDDNSLEQVLWKIEMVHSRVHKLKSQIDMVMSKNAAKFSSSENLSLLAPGDAQASSARSPTFSVGIGEAISVGAMYSPNRHISEYEIVDLVLPESGTSSYGEAIPVPDIIESTVGLLSAADVTLHESQIGDSCEDIMDNVLIHNEAAEVDIKPFKITNNQLILKKHEEVDIKPFKITNNQLILKKHEESRLGEAEETKPSLLPSTEAEPSARAGSTGEHSTLKSSLASDFHVPTNKRKRGERKGGSGGWRRRSGSGEPDSQ